MQVEVAVIIHTKLAIFIWFTFIDAIMRGTLKYSKYTEIRDQLHKKKIAADCDFFLYKMTVDSFNKS